jgi:1,4-dihydroxy-2-naphthoyl-CoA hydrolase
MINQNITLEQLNALNKNTMGEFLGIEYTEIGTHHLCGRMPVDNRTRQPLGLLHGGASVVLAETLGSVAATCCVNRETHYCVGLEINANHVKSVRDGYVYGKASAIHIGGSTQIWEIRITSETGGLVCISRITMAVLAHRKHA